MGLLNRGVKIRKLTEDDYEALTTMKTGIENDYVIRVFPRLLERDTTYGTFIDDRLISLAAYTVYGGEYAVLGRLRTDLRYRGQGLSTAMLQMLCNDIEEHSDFRWVGLTTLLDNKPVHRIAEKLDMELLWTFHACKLTEQGEKALEQLEPECKDEWREIGSNEEKRRLLRSLKEGGNALNVFPYASYYPLPFEESLLQDDYLSKCRFWRRGERFVSLMPDDKGISYYHMKYFWNDIFSQPGLWPKMIQEARQAGRTLWIDLTPEVFSLLTEGQKWFDQKLWTLWGRYSTTS